MNTSTTVSTILDLARRLPIAVIADATTPFEAALAEVRDALDMEGVERAIQAHTRRRANSPTEEQLRDACGSCPSGPVYRAVKMHHEGVSAAGHAYSYDTIWLPGRLGWLPAGVFRALRYARRS